jgi:hypothetical protein
MMLGRIAHMPGKFQEGGGRNMVRVGEQLLESVAEQPRRQADMMV